MNNHQVLQKTDTSEKISLAYELEILVMRLQKVLKGAYLCHSC